MEMFTGTYSPIVGLLAFRALQLSIVLFSNENLVPVNEMENYLSGHAGMVLVIGGVDTVYYFHMLK